MSRTETGGGLGRNRKPTQAGLGGWLEERLGLRAIREFLAHKTVPVHSATMWYYFGGITLFLFVIQVLTGILLLLYYRPTATEAYESVQFIMTRVQFGWLVRSIHSWSANLMIFAAFVHMFSVVFLRSYRRPREVTWLSGIALLGLALGFGFSGYLLPWNTISYFATKVGTDMAASLPVVGPTLARFLRGGEDVGGRHPDAFLRFPRGRVARPRLPCCCWFTWRWCRSTASARHPGSSASSGARAARRPRCRSSRTFSCAR